MNGSSFTSRPFLDGEPIQVDNFDYAFPPALAFAGDVSRYHLLGNHDPSEPINLHQPYENGLSDELYPAPSVYSLKPKAIEGQSKILYLDPINLVINGADVPLRCLYRASNGLILSMDAEISNLSIELDADEIREYRNRLDSTLSEVLFNDRTLNRFRAILRKMIAFFVHQHPQNIELVFTCTSEFMGYNMAADQINSLVSVFTSSELSRIDWNRDKLSVLDQVIDNLLLEYADRVQDDQVQAGSDEIIAEVHTILLRELRVFIRSKNGRELNLEASVRRPVKRVKNPLLLMKGACGKDFMPSEQARYLRKHLVDLDPIDSDMSIMRWNCGLRCLIYAAIPEKREFYQKNMKKLALEAIELRKNFAGLLNGEGPIRVEEILELSRQLEIKTIIKLWTVGEGFSKMIGSHEGLLDHPEEATALMALVKGHYVLAKDLYHWDLLSTAYKFCSKCSKLRDAYDHDTLAQPCKGKKGKRQHHEIPDPDELVEPKRFKNVMPLSNKTKITPKSKMIVCDFETWRKPVGDGKFFHEVYASALQIGIEDLDFEKMIVYYGSDSLRQTCEKLKEVALTTSDKDPYYLYFYNGSGFDNVFLLNCFIKEMNITPDNVVLKDGRVMAATFFGGTLHLRDLYLFTRCKLSEACKSFGVPSEYSKGDFDHEKMKTEADLATHREECVSYLKNDITATSIVLNNFWDATKKEFDIDFCPNLTSSHMAYDCWRKTLPFGILKDLKLPRTTVEDGEMRRAYYGGRVFPGLKAFESSQLAEMSTLTYEQLMDYLIDLDVASLYPAAMAGCDGVSNYETIMPYFCGEFFFSNAKENTKMFNGLKDALLDFQDKLDQKFGGKSYIEYMSNIYSTVGIDLHRLYRNDQGFDIWRNDLFPFMKQGAIVTVDLTCPTDLKVPLLPAKTPKGGIEWDLTPKRNQSYSIDELVEAMVNGYRVNDVQQAIIFTKRQHLFKKHIKTNFDMKKNADRGDPKRDIAKNNMNHTYGKFGQEIIKTKVSYKTHFQLDEMMEELSWTEHIVSVQPILDNSKLIEKVQLPPLLKNTFLSEEVNDENFMEMLENLNAREVISFKVEEEAKDLAPTKPVYIALQTTANSHMIMNRYLIPLSILQNRIFSYTDTDSLVVRARYMELLTILMPGIIGKKLGQLDDELEGGKVWAAYAIAPKFYCLCYMKPDGKSYIKIRTKGFPHIKNAVLIEDGFIERSMAAAEPYLAYAEEDCEDPEEEGQYLLKGMPYFNKNAYMPLQLIIYSVSYQDGRREYMTHLNHHVYKAMVSGEVRKLRVFFSSMKRQYDNSHGSDIAAIEHVKLSRSLNPLSWWNNDDAVRKTLSDNIFDETYPKGHSVLQRSEVSSNFGESTAWISNTGLTSQESPLETSEMNTNAMNSRVHIYNNSPY